MKCKGCSGKVYPYCILVEGNITSVLYYCISCNYSETQSFKFSWKESLLQRQAFERIIEAWRVQGEIVSQEEFDEAE